MGTRGRLGVLLLVAIGCLCSSYASPNSHIVSVFHDSTSDNSTTGPSEDSTECSGYRDCPDKAKVVLTNNVNKALVVDYSRAKLISCGSLYQGMCWILGLDNVSSTSDTDAVNEPIVANNESASTVAFIAPGPPTPPTSTVLYVGVTYTGNSPYRHEVPAVSSRSLNPRDNFGIVTTGVSSGTKMHINMREQYPINYVYGFSSEGFSYFLTTQKKDTKSDSPFISKLVRVCQNDSNYYSYTEIPIECVSETTGNKFSLVQAAFVGKPGPDLANKLDVTHQDDVLFAVFARADPIGSSIPGQDSALCVYSLKDIRRKFVENIEMCFQGKGNRGLGFIAMNAPCVSTKLKIIEEDFCGMDVNTPLGGEKPAVAMSVLNFTTPLTSVAATSAGNYTVVFLGTRYGHLKKVVVESGKSGSEYDDIVIDPAKKVNPDMFFDPQKAHLYVMTERKVSKVLVHNCSEYVTCNGCVEAGDPYCGWCSLQNKCTLKNNCPKGPKATEHSLYWISYKSGQCTRITMVNPSQLQSSTARTLTLSIDHLPTRSGDFWCVFRFLSGKTLKTHANLTSNGVTCYTPPTSDLPPIPKEQHNFTATLSVRMAQDGAPANDFVATDFVFFDCNTYVTCTSCVTSPFPCDWCVDKHRCTHDTAENCRNDILVTGLNRVGPSIRSGPGFCPRINVTNGSSELLVPFGTQKRIQVKVDNIAQQIIVQTRFSCRFSIEGRVTPANAQLVENTIYCDPIQFNYNSPAPNITVPFAVVWGGGETKSLDNPDEIHIKVYRCPAMADNCGMCLAMDEKFNCGWCQSSNRCQVREQCDNGMGVWLNRNQTCPNPEIRNFHPKSGPWEGGTNVTIDGINLGKTFDDIYSGVTVAGVSCEPFRHQYQQTRRIVCRLDGPGINEPKAGPIIVKVADYRAQSVENYRFVDPKIRGVSPSRGPMAGGTKITIFGEHLNAGSHIQAFVDSIPCEILSKEANRIQCRSGRSMKTGKWHVVIKFDQRERIYEPGFTYVDNPVIQLDKDKPLRGIPAGGINITVEGRNFDVVQEPFIYVMYNGTSYSGPCNISSNETMFCLTPKVGEEDLPFSDPDGKDGMRLQYGFILDTVDTGVQNLSEENKSFHLFPNPQYDQFEEKIKKYKSDYLTINGRNLNTGSDESDLIVLIGNSVCNVTSLSKNQLTCKPPPHQPPDVGEDGRLDSSRPPTVMVKIGKNLAYEIGRLRYDHISPVEFPQKVMYIMIAGGVVLLIIFIIILIAYRRKSTENNRVLKNMQEQMDVLELRVAAECKEAFAELQTEMTDLTGDVTSGGIPFLDYRNYSMKILFPNGEDHAVLQLDRPELHYKAKGLRHFGLLILNKTFLLLFIRTLENNRYFSMRDRVNVASLIMVSLQGKMEYCTDILKTLLAELIEKSMESKNHPKLLLRRTESVAEKMLSAWFTFLLYKFLKECAGEPLYMLYRAIKQQVDKGPVDAVTAEARYSLSEEKLIRQSIGYKPMTVFVSMSHQTTYMTGLDLNQENTDVPVKVLDCDTISQVKEKALDTIYRATSYSQRPRKEDLDLEWRTGNKGRLILYDDDSTTKTEGEWKKLNTLSHYRVPDAACLTLVPKQSSMYNLSILSERSEKSHKYETLNLSKYNSASPPLSRATSPLNHDREGGMKVWHLVKHHDSDNQKEGERGNKMVSEIYLTRLLATKLTLQKFVDDLFETIFSTAHRGSALPLAIKYMFDFLDDQAIQHGITDPEVVHTWKSNSLPLRFWVNLIKNPNFVYDIHKSNIVDSCLSVVAQTFMDACSTSEHRLGKDSPSSKLLYAKDIPSYKEWVERYYADIKAMPCISDQDMNAMLAEESRLHSNEFSTESALLELYNYASKYNDQLMMTLEEDEFSQKQRLAYKLEQVHTIMASEGH
ncbi:unnamed protein product [Allacma fusca]|uniref:Sema domain-containing protein n=1 Tax=Allacma fusca TaxID=39272 RepID=A0A8J2K5E0_9HEXA|nr:unnamed protein product [Allacma fusca]